MALPAWYMDFLVVVNGGVYKHLFFVF